MTAFLLTWKEAGWPRENIERMAAQFDRAGEVVEPWRIAAHRQVKPGDEAWLLKQGKGPTGIFGFGVILSNPREVMQDDGTPRQMVDVKFEAFCDPAKGFFVLT